MPRQTCGYNFVGGNALLALGVNFNLGDYTTLFTEWGAGYMGDFSLRYSIRGKTLGMLATMGIMFRINDKFQDAEKIL